MTASNEWVIAEIDSQIAALDAIDAKLAWVPEALAKMEARVDASLAAVAEQKRVEREVLLAHVNGETDAYGRPIRK